MMYTEISLWLWIWRLRIPTLNNRKLTGPWKSRRCKCCGGRCICGIRCGGLCINRRRRPTSAISTLLPGQLSLPRAPQLCSYNEPFWQLQDFYFTLAVVVQAVIKYSTLNVGVVPGHSSSALGGLAKAGGRRYSFLCTSPI